MFVIFDNIPSSLSFNKCNECNNYKNLILNECNDCLILMCFLCDKMESGICKKCEKERKLYFIMKITNLKIE